MAEYGIPTIGYAYSSHNDGCGQAAAAVIIDYWKTDPFIPGVCSDLNCVADQVYAAHPPDTGIIHLGSTPGHVENICKCYKLITNRFCNAPVNACINTLQQAIQQNRPVIVLMDAGKLPGGANFQGHYLVAYKYDDSGVYVSNYLDPSGAYMKWNDFSAAWNPWFIPGGDFHYAGIVTWR